MYNLKILGSISPYCKKDMNCPGYMIFNDNNKILLDCGFGVSRLLDFPNNLENLIIIISHYHKDHYADLFAIKYAVLCYERLGLLKTSVKVYIPKVQKDDEFYLDYCLIKSEEEKKFKIFEYDDSNEIKIDDISIEFIQTYHSIKNYSVKLTCNDKKIVYSGDMGYKNIEKYINFVKNANLFICECSFLEAECKDNKYHLHTDEVALISKLSGCKKVILTHTWPEHDKYEYINEVKKTFENVHIATEESILYNIFDNK